MGLRRIRTIAFLVAVAAYFGVGVTTQAALDWCSDVCTVASSCNQVCYTACNECPAFQTTCGGASGGQCENTCDSTCSPSISGSTYCTDYGGSSSSCGGWGRSDSCGDGVCNGDNEDVSSCSSDCGTVAHEEDEEVLQSMLDDMDAVGGFNGTINGASAGLEVFFDYGYPSGSYESYDENDIEEEHEITCAEKEIQIAATDKVIKRLKQLEAVLVVCAIVMPTCGYALYQTVEAINAAKEIRGHLEGHPCKPLPD